MPGIEVTSRGLLTSDAWRSVVPRTVARWLRGVMEFGQRYARSIAPVLTGTFRRSITVSRVRVVGSRMTAELYSTDVPGKVRVIEDGFEPRPLARQPKSGPTRMGRGRVGVRVFARTHLRVRGLIATQGERLASEVARELTR